MNETQQPTGIVGNTQNRQNKSTLERDESKQLWMRRTFQVGAAVVAVVILVQLANARLNLFWLVVTSALLWYAATVLDKQGLDLKKIGVHYMPAVLRTASVLVAIGAVLNSGIGKWTEGWVQSIDQKASLTAANMDAKNPCPALPSTTDIEERSEFRKSGDEWTLRVRRGTWTSWQRLEDKTTIAKGIFPWRQVGLCVAYRTKDGRTGLKYRPAGSTKKVPSAEYYAYSTEVDGFAFHLGLRRSKK